MRCFRQVALLFCLLAGAAGCKDAKPSEEECRKALKHILQINQDPEGDRNDALESWVRNCRAFSGRETVKCMTDAKTREDLQKCEGSELTPKTE